MTGLSFPTYSMAGPTSQKTVLAAQCLPGASSQVWVQGSDTVMLSGRLSCDPDLGASYHGSLVHPS